MDVRGQRVIEEWRKDLEERQRGQLDSKLVQLESFGPEELKGTKFCSRLTGGLWKLRVKTKNVEARLIFCKGPIENDREVTLLMGAMERDRKLVPEDALNQAGVRLREVSQFPEERRAKWRDKNKAE